MVANHKWVAAATCFNTSPVLGIALGVWITTGGVVHASAPSGGWLAKVDIVKKQTKCGLNTVKHG
jgi:hypothetical protein